MSVENEMFDLLNEKVFKPALKSKDVTDKTIKGVKRTIQLMEKRKLDKMLEYYWRAIIGTEKSIAHSTALRKAYLLRFEDLIDEIHDKFGEHQNKLKITLRIDFK